MLPQNLDCLLQTVVNANMVGSAPEDVLPALQPCGLQHVRDAVERSLDLTDDVLFVQRASSILRVPTALSCTFDEWCSGDTDSLRVVEVITLYLARA